MARLNPIAGTAAVLVLQLLTPGLVLAAVELPAVSAQEGPVRLSIGDRPAQVSVLTGLDLGTRAQQVAIPAQMPWLAQQGPDKSASDKDDC